MREKGVPFVEHLLPRYDVQSQHAITIRSSAADVYRQTRRLDLSSSPLVRWLFRLRGFPPSALSLDGLSSIRFVPLVEQPPVGFVFGLVGQFWRPSGNLLDFEPSDFPDLQPPGYAKAIWSFDISFISASSSRLRTVTRVACPDRKTRRRFKLYWSVVGPFSGLIRREFLEGAKRACEGGEYPRP